MPDDSNRQPLWLWALLGLVVAFLGWNTFSGIQAMNRMGADMRALGDAGTTPGDEWLAQLRADPTAAHAAASADFRRRVPADRLATFARTVPDPALLKMRSFGGGSVTSGLFTGPRVVSPRLVLDGPGGLTLEFVLEDGQPRLDALTVNGASP